MYDADLNRLLADLDAERERQADRRARAHAVLERVERTVPGSVLRCAAGIALRRLDCVRPISWDEAVRDPEKPRRTRENIAPEQGRRLIVRCDRPGCDHAVLMDARPVFGGPRSWPLEGDRTVSGASAGIAKPWSPTPTTPQGRTVPSVSTL